MSEIRRNQIQRNRMARDAWALYQPHRQQVTEALVSAAQRPDSQDMKLALLGAGNCNDVDLQQLLQCYREIHLIDLDVAVLTHGVNHQMLAHDTRVIRHPSVDLTGLASWLDQSEEDQASDQRLLEGIELANSAALPELPDDIDVVGSTCVMTQLFEVVVNSVGTTSATALDLLFAVRNRHMRTLCELPRRGGTGVLVTDFVSSDTVPEMASIPDSEMATHARSWIEARNFFTGVNPFALLAILDSDPWFKARVRSISASLPWKWQYLHRMYAVCAIQAELHID